VLSSVGQSPEEQIHGRQETINVAHLMGSKRPAQRSGDLFPVSQLQLTDLQSNMIDFPKLSIGGHAERLNDIIINNVSAHTNQFYQYLQDSAVSTCVTNGTSVSACTEIDRLCFWVRDC
jgi:hypothetical protein